MYGFSENDLLRSLCRDSFYEFVREFWPVIIQKKPVWNWHIKFLCDLLQELVERVFEEKQREHDVIINLPPGMSKSTTISVMLPAWVWTRHPYFRTIVTTHTYNPLGLDLSRKCRDIVQSAKFKELFPDIQLREDQNTKGFFQNTYGGWRLTSTIGGVSPEGLHGDLLVVDDPIDPQHAMSEADLKTANEWMTDSLPSRKTDKGVVPTVMVMHRVHQEDPTGTWLERGGDIKHICLPADMNEGYEVIPKELEENYTDGLLDPVRLPHKVLAEYKLLGEYSYASQFQQSPVPAGGIMFDVNAFEVIREDQVPDYIDDALKEGNGKPNKYLVKIVRYWDKAGTPGGGTYTVGVKMAVDNTNTFYVLDVKRGQWAVDKREQIILQTAEEDGEHVNVYVEQEPGSGGKESADYTIRRLAGFKVYADRPTGKKVDRADPFAAEANAGHVKVVKAEWNRAVFQELRFFPVSKYKDITDASSGAFSKLTRRQYSLKEWLNAEDQRQPEPKKKTGRFDQVS